MKNFLLLIFVCSATLQAQKTKLVTGNKESEDLKYEIKHKNKSWFSGMKEGANYLEIKNNFDKYFSNHKWEKSRNRSLGEDWIKSKIFYLDKNGIVQPEPELNISRKTNVVTQTTIGSWNILGPSNSATTGYSSPGNHGGYVYLNRIDPTNTQKMFAAFVTGGLWKTEDGGTNWILTDSNFADNTYNDIDVCIAAPQTVYALSTKQLLKSTDGGSTWQATTLNSTNYSGKAYDIAVSTVNPNVVIVRWGDKIARTTDGGTTWNAIVTGLPNYEIWDCSAHSEMLDWSTTDNTVVYFISTSNNNQFKLYRSSDSGATFSVIATTTLDASSNGQTIGWAKLLLPTNNVNSIYIAVGTGANPNGHYAVQLYKMNATTGILDFLRLNMVTGIGDAYENESVMHHGDITMDYNDENKIAYGAYGNSKFKYSTDNGVTFTLSTNYTHTDIRTLSMVSNKIMVGSDGEAVLSSDGGITSNTITNSISNHELWGFGSAFKSDLVASGNNHGPVMIKEAANGFDWYNGFGADQGNTDVNPLDDRYIYSQGFSNYRYFRTGVHTLVNEPNFLDLGGIYSYFNSIEFHPNKYYSIITHHAGQYPTGNANLATWKNSLIKTEDNGNSISIVKTFTNQVVREKISMKNPNVIYVIEGLLNNKLWKTSDSGVTWTNITPSTLTTSGQTNISDIAVSDVNPNEVWVTYSGVQTTCKIIKSLDSGVTWTNLTMPNLTSFPITKIIFQRGSNGGVYVGNKSGIYYRNNTMATWDLLGNGLPQSEIRFMFINYNKGKLKIGTSRGAFEHDLYETSPPSAQISVGSTKVTCPTIEKVKFKDYSVVRNATATWLWSFPGGTPSISTEENPEISYENAANGLYNVSLTVTDAFGTDTQTLTNFIEVNNLCGTAIPEAIPGNVAKITGQSNGDFLEVNNLNLNKNSVTFSCWIKPNGIQTDSSPIFMTQNDTNAFGLNFRSTDNSIGFHPDYNWGSGLQTPQNEWSHIAMVSNGTNVKIYVNGKERIRNTGMSSEIFNTIFIGNYGRGRIDRFANFEIDEVSIWNRPLNIDEIRKFRHLTKNVSLDPIQTGLVAYYQFNETAGNLSINKTINTNALTYKGSGFSHQVSNAPVFGGLSEKINVNSSGNKDFSTVGLEMNFQPSIYPNGDVWVSRSTINPDVLPDTNTSFNSYTIVNNYGTNQTISPLQSITFKNNSLYPSSVEASTFSLYKRDSNAFGNTWSSSLDSGDNIVGSGINTAITFSTGLNLTSFSQFALSNNSALSIENFVENPKPKLYPNPLKNNEPLKVLLPLNWEKSSIIIYDSNGKTIAQTALEIENTELLLNAPKGIYYYIIFNKDNKISGKLIIK